MRYQNWDVLLFPANSRIPMQEFDTKCHVVADQRRFPPVATSLSESDPFLANFESMTKLPILTCFISSLSHGQPFRVSIHSWTKPRGSSLLESYRAVNEAVSFQARIYIDGVLQCYRSFDQDTIWPEVIETSAIHRLDDANASLRFPPFHQEILEQSHWEANEQFGRIRIVIAEGVTQEATLTEPSRFIVLRDVVAFSFQHAPQNVLEYSGIAWPNRRMFEPIRPDASSKRFPVSRGHEIHSHSPQRAITSGIDEPTGYVGSNVPQIQAKYPFRTILGHSKSYGHVENNDTMTSSLAVDEIEDPFLMPPPSQTHQWRLQLRSSSHDVSMPDYVSQKTGSSRANTDMSGISFPRRDFERQVNEAAIDEIIQALSPVKKQQLVNALSPVESPSTGLNAPTNTPMTALDGSQQASPEAQALTKNFPKKGVPLPGLELSNSKLRSPACATPKKSGTTSAISSVKSQKYGTIDQEACVRMLSTALNTWQQPNIIDLTTVTSEPVGYSRQRSGSGSSKRKRSLSPITNECISHGMNKPSPQSDSSEDRDIAIGELNQHGVSLQL